VTASQRWCRILIVGRDRTLARFVLEGEGAPGLDAVDVVARWGLLARRLDARLVCRDATPALRELLLLAGLDVEVQRQPERGEEPLGIQRREEEVHPGDAGT
jgi:hypothetical protein